MTHSSVDHSRGELWVTMSKSTLLLFTITICLIIGCSDDPVIKASLPASLGVNPSLFIGQEVDEFLSEVDCVEDDSDHHYCCNISYGDYFNYLCINEGTAGSSVIMTIVLSMSYSGNDLERSMKLESNARVIINILIEAYGDNFEITESFHDQPKLVWKDDSCLVSYTFMPESLYNVTNARYGEVLNAFNVLLITSTDVMGYSEPVRPSQQYSKESLGIN